MQILFFGTPWQGAKYYSLAFLQWRYCLRLENLGEQTVQLRERNWKIFSLSGTLETVRGRGVVGKEPILSRLQPAFQYSSHVSLQVLKANIPVVSLPMQWLFSLD